MGSEQKAVGIVVVGNLHNTSVRFNDESSRQIGSFGIESDSLEWRARICIAKCRHTVRFGTSLGIIDH